MPSSSFFIIPYFSPTSLTVGEHTWRGIDSNIPKLPIHYFFLYLAVKQVILLQLFASWLSLSFLNFYSHFLPPFFLSLLFCPLMWFHFNEKIVSVIPPNYQASPLLISLLKAFLSPLLMERRTSAVAVTHKLRPYQQLCNEVSKLFLI